jgi:hypothetical protein
VSELAWSVLLDGLGLVPLLLARYKRPETWLAATAMMALWVAYALDRGGYGFIPGAVIYAAVYLANWVKWRADDRQTATTASPGGRP